LCQRCLSVSGQARELVQLRGVLCGETKGEESRQFVPRVQEGEQVCE